nr:RNA polymerase sigma factor [candidate division Zixibacteria bacterium]
MDLDDKELVAQAKAGDRKAFDKLVKRYKDKMFALTYRMTGDREAALDLVQDTFFSAYRELRGFREDANLSSWLYRIASNKSLNFLRRRKLVSFLPLGESPSSEPAYEMEDQVTYNELSKEMAAGIENLPGKQKLVFNLRFFEKMSFPEIAAVLNKSESTVKTNYQKAVEKLQKRLKAFR